MGFITIFHHHLDPNLCWKLVLFRIEEQYANKSKVFEWAIQLDLFLVLIFSRWWFQICSIFTPIWGRFPFWLIFFRWVETTNQLRRMRKTPPRKHLKSIKMGKIRMMIKRKKWVAHSRRDCAGNEGSRLELVLPVRPENLCAEAIAAASAPDRSTSVGRWIGRELLPPPKKGKGRGEDPSPRPPQQWQPSLRTSSPSVLPLSVVGAVSCIGVEPVMQSLFC